jgi:hypothetical protein
MLKPLKGKVITVKGKLSLKELDALTRLGALVIFK